MTQFLSSDIFLTRYGMNADWHAGAVVLLENGWALNISQSDISTPELSINQVPLADAKFTCETMRPWPNTPGSEPKILGCNSDHGLEGFGRNYAKTNMSLVDIAKTLTALAQQPAASEFTIKEIVDANRTEKAPYSPSQIGKTPICRGSGAELDAEFLREKMREGILRDPFDYKHPLKFPFFQDAEIQMQTGTDTNGVDTFQYLTMLLPTGHAFYAEEIVSDDPESETRFEITALAPDNQSILQPTKPLDLDDLFDGFNHVKPENAPLTKSQLTDLANAFIRQRSVLPPHRLKQIVAINAQNQNADFPVTQFNRVQMDENTGAPLGITLIEPGSAPGDHHP